MESRRGNIVGFIKFFLQCVIDQCNNYIYKIAKIKEIYREDMKKIECIKGNSVYRIMPVIMRQIVFTKKEVQDESGVSVNAVSNIINQLVELGIIIPDSTVIKKGYGYQKNKAVSRMSMSKIPFLKVVRFLKKYVGYS